MSVGKIRRSLAHVCVELVHARWYFRRLFMKKGILLVVAFVVLPILSGLCQEGWRTTLFIAPGYGKVLATDTRSISGAAGLQYGFHRGPLIAGGGLTLHFLQSARRASFNGLGRASQPFVEFPIGVGVSTKPNYRQHFEFKADFGYLASLNMAHRFITFSPQVAVLWKNKGNGSTGILLKAMNVVGRLSEDVGYQPAFYGGGLILNLY
jgi:hypothetical protein